MKVMLIPFLILALAGCAGSQQQYAATPDRPLAAAQNPPMESRRAPASQHYDDRVLLLRNEIARSKESEYAHLWRVKDLIEAAAEQARHAEQSSNDDARLIFKYSDFYLDLQAILFGLTEYLAAEDRAPRTPRNNFHRVKAEYLQPGT